MSISNDSIRAVLGTDIDPYLGIDLVKAGAVKDIKIDDSEVRVQIELGMPAAVYGPELAARLQAKLAPVAGGRRVRIEVDSKIQTHAVQQGVKPLQSIRNTIAIASGKGGVGKSTTAVNLALALQREGASVGVLDADIYGPSQPLMLGCQGAPEITDAKRIVPMQSFGIQSISIGNLIDEETPMIWRGPMATGALQQLLNDTDWQPLDYLVIDLPPGTGDIQLTLCQQIPLSGAVIVTTPQDIALLDARRGLKMFEKVGVPVLGIVENMSTHICGKCGHEEHIFGAGGGARMADQYGVDLLGSLPLDIRIREGVDHGRPTVMAEPDSAIAHNYIEIARKVTGKLARRAKDFTAKFPRIVVENK
ncbi:MAG: iron-sulfur cluster carrier protein ApbC [Gammaproteobacteria bacterium]|nr:iron-sulfur cluster carrier protein ApbC [Gammaproteobacteria bacterium]